MPIFDRTPAAVIPLQINLPVTPQQAPVNLPSPVPATHPVQPQQPTQQQPDNQTGGDFVGGEDAKKPSPSKPTRRTLVLPFAG